MHGLVLAGGEGSRLAASGVDVPKAFVPVAGDPQLVRMVRIFRDLGCETITCAVRQDLVRAVEELAASNVNIVPVRTPSSLHTLDLALRAIPSGDVLCTLVDTVMPDHDWLAAHRAATDLLSRSDLVVAVTPLVHDESPLWVALDGTRVTGFGAPGSPAMVTGGVYWLRQSARAAVHQAVADGDSRIRGWLARMINEDRVVTAVTVDQIIDVDTAADLKLADALLAGITQ